MTGSKLWPRVSGWSPYARSILRIAAAGMFMLPPDGATARLISQIGIGGVLEVVGGGLLLIGLFTRPAAFILSGEMAVAYFQFHAPQSIWPTMNGGVAAALYCFVWLYFSAAGPGPWSIDAHRGK
jgi:putative oxidoreductase